MASVGPIPKAVTNTDDTLMNLQALGMDQIKNTEHIMQDVHKALEDDLVTREELVHIAWHVIDEHKLNEKANKETTGLRTYFEKFNALVVKYRARLERRNAAGTASRAA